MHVIEIRKQWYYAGTGLVEGRTPLLHAGIYRVPQDISPELAQRALAEGIAVELGKDAAAQSIQGIPKRWPGRTVIVAAPGPSLTADVVKRCQDRHTVAVQDAYRLMPWADVLYGCDVAWWKVHDGCQDFSGEKWSTHDVEWNNKQDIATEYGVHLIAGKHAEGFSLDPTVVHYGSNSGFQAVNLAILMGAAKIVLVGFDMRVVNGKRHFWGDHPKPLINSADFSTFIPPFERASRSLPHGLQILNATPGSALTCFPMVSLRDALSS